MIELQYEMTYEETIAGPLGSTRGSPLGERLCWKVETGRLHGPRIEATLAMPGVDLMRVGPDGLRRPTSTPSSSPTTASSSSFATTWP